jgi:hypothetical protein
MGMEISAMLTSTNRGFTFSACASACDFFCHDDEGNPANSASYLIVAALFTRCSSSWFRGRHPTNMRWILD